MTGKTVPLLTVFLLAAEFLVFSGSEMQNNATGKKPAGPQSHYFQESGVQVDNVVDRIRFKISYSWDKAWEYFRLACSSVPDAVPAKARDADSRIKLKTDELVEQGRQAIKDTADRTMKDITEKGREIGEDIKKTGKDITEKGREIGEDIKKTGKDIKTEAGKKFRENTDKMFK